MAATQVVGTNTTKVQAGSFGDNWVDQGQVYAPLQVYYDEYEADGVESGSTIDIAEFVSGTIIIGGRITFDALGGSSTLALGDDDTAARYIAASSSATAGNIDINLADGVGYTTGQADGDTTLVITTGGATITGTIKSVIYYTNGVPV